MCAFEIEVAAPGERVAALTLVLRNSAEAGRKSLIRQTLESGEPACAHLLVARRGAEIVGAVWSQVQPGGAAHLWLPQIEKSQAAELRTHLLQAAIKRLERDVQLVQALLSEENHNDAELLVAAGFTHISDLLYLVSTRLAFPDECPQTGLHFEVFSPQMHDRLARIIEATYEATRDCPQLNGLRSIDDVLAGYRATGRFATKNWVLVRESTTDQHQDDVGCILLAEHAKGTWELVYMGIVPAARGRGFGVELARYAQWHVGQAGGETLVLAVDAANEPAVAIYATAGFTAWERRSVYLRTNFKPQKTDP